RAKAAWTMLVITPQTVSIAVGAALISYLSYRVMLLAVVAVLAACAAVILIHPAPEPLAGATPEAVPEPARDTVLSGREAQGAVEADDLAVEVVVLGDALDHGRVLGRPAHPPGVRDLRAPNNRWYSRRWLRPSKLPSGSARRSRQPRRLSHGSVIPQVELLVSKKRITLSRMQCALARSTTGVRPACSRSRRPHARGVPDAYDAPDLSSPVSEAIRAAPAAGPRRRPGSRCLALGLGEAPGAEVPDLVRVE